MARVLSAVILLLGVSSVVAQWTLNKIDLATYPMAQCLDGSPGAFYVSPGSGTGADSWEIHLQGGGWCDSDEDCVLRSKGNNPFGQSVSLGGSGAWASTGCPNDQSPVCVADGGAGGLLNADAAVNPFSYNWNKVYVGYCDGGSFSGSVTEPQEVTVNGSSYTIYYRGRYILDAVFDTLATIGLQSAKEVVLTGSSAGGLATFLHVEQIAKRIKSYNYNARVVAAPGAGFFLDTDSFEGANVGRPIFSWLYDRMNMTQSLNSDCRMVYQGAAWMCMYAQYNLPFIRTPLFVSNSLADVAQASFLMELGCDPTKEKSCSDVQMTYLDAYGKLMVDLLRSIVHSEQNGAFLPQCWLHLIEDVDGAWNGITVEGQTQVETFSAWYSDTNRPDTSNVRGEFGGPAAVPTSNVMHAVVDGVYGTNPTCSAYDRSRDQTALFSSTLAV